MRLLRHSIAILLVHRKITELIVVALTLVKGFNLVFTQVVTCELQLYYSDLIELIEAVVIILREANLKVLCH